MDRGGGVNSQVTSRGPASVAGHALDRVILLKPRVMSLVVFTGGVGLAAAPGATDPIVAIVTLVCMAAGAGACGALNMWFDADIDALMQRTSQRPVPAGKISAHEALIEGGLLAILSVLCLGIYVNWTASALLALTIFIYQFVYTMALKRRWSQNIVIGGASGALPPVIGWAAQTGTVEWGAFALFLIIFLWTPPHFWTLAIGKSADYARARVPMLPVVAGPQETCRQIALYAVALVASTYWPIALGYEGAVYGVLATAFNAAFIWRTIQLYRNRADDTHVGSAYRLFGTSILYLFGIFTALLAGIQ